MRARIVTQFTGGWEEAEEGIGWLPFKIFKSFRKIRSASKCNITFWVVPVEISKQMGCLKPVSERRATALPNSIDPIKLDFSTAVGRRLKPSLATAV